MSQIRTDRLAHQRYLRFVPTDAGTPAMHFQAHERPNGQEQMAPHRPVRPHVGALDPAALLQSTVIDLNAPALLGQRGPLGFSHGSIIGHPGFRVAVWGDHPEDVDEPIAAQMHHAALSGDRDVRDGHGVAAALQRDQTVGLQAGQEGPVQSPQDLEVLEARIPAVEQDGGRRQPAALGHGQHLPEVGVLRVPTRRLVIDPEVAGQPVGARRPQQRQQVDPFDDPMMLAAPMVRDQPLGLGVGFIQRRVVQDQHAFPPIHEIPDFPPQRRRVGRLSLQQSGKRIMGRWVTRRGRTAGGLCAGEDLLGCNEELDVVQRIALGRIHGRVLLADWRRSISRQHSAMAWNGQLRNS